VKVCGYGLRDHIRLLVPLFALLTVVWALRLILAASGAPSGLTRLASLTVMGPAVVVLAALLMHERRFGSYTNVVLASFLLNAWAELLIVAAITFTVLTGKQNIYTAPEFSVPRHDPSHVGHILGHLTFGIGFGTLVGAAEGCLLLWLLRKLTPKQRE
jgi:hypothetical protein